MFKFLHIGKNNTSQSAKNSLLKKAEDSLQTTVTFYFEECHFVAEREVRPQKNGDQFLLDGKMTDFRELPFESESYEDAENGVWMRDERNGRFILFFWESIPTFDSGDRIYDSAAKWYFMCDNGNISVLNIRHGYQLGSVRIYQNIRAENDAAAAIIRRIHDKYGIKAQEVKGMNNETRSRR